MMDSLSFSSSICPLRPSFGIRVFETGARPLQLSIPREPDRVAERARRVQNFPLEVAVFIELAVRGRVWLHVANIPVESAKAPRRNQVHIGQPVGQGSPHALATDAVAVDNQA